MRDIIFGVDALPCGPGKLHSDTRREVGGGPAANAAVTVTAMGGESRFIGPVGDDRLGIELIGELESRGVDVSRVRIVPGYRTPVSAITVDTDGERSIVNHSDPGLFEQAKPIDSGDLQGVDAVLTDVRWSGGAVVAMRSAALAGIPGVVDFDVGATGHEALLEAASHVVFSASAIRSLTGMHQLEDALLRLGSDTDAWMAATDGERGVFYVEDTVIGHMAAFPVDVVDTTGAGDVFHGAFTLELARGESEQTALRTASAAAALTCTRFGGRDGIPTREEVDSLLEEST